MFCREFIPSTSCEFYYDDTCNLNIASYCGILTTSILSFFHNSLSATALEVTRK